MTDYVNSGYGRLRKVLLCRPDYYRLMPSNNTSREYLEKGEGIDPELVKIQYEEFCLGLTRLGVELIFLEPRQDLPYQIFTRDLGTVTPMGAALGQFKWNFRRREIELAEEVIAMHVPIWKQIPNQEGVTFEGGDFVYMDAHTVALGVAGRTSEAGASVVQKWLNDIDYEVLPIHFDPEYCHLDMVFNVVAEKTCVACCQLLPKEFIQRIKREAWNIVETTPGQVLGLLGNLFAVDNGVVISPAHNKIINSQLKRLGVEVIEVNMGEILRGGGGPHCMTYPLLRDSI